MTVLQNVNLILALLVGLLGTAVPRPAAAQSQLLWDTVNGRSLRGNLLGDSPARSVIVYLPPSYAVSPDRRYPVVYLLHGNASHNSRFTDGSYTGFRLQNDMDSLIAASTVREFIVVVPDAYNRYRGSHYTNSSVTGNWQDFIARELVAYIDGKYRTLAKRESRGLAGYSMGGRGALAIAMRVPGVFSALYAMSPGRLAFETTRVFPDSDWRATLALRQSPPATTETIRVLSYATAFSPNPRRPPFYVDLPFKIEHGELVTVPAIWRKWLANDPVAMVPAHRAALNGLNAFQLDCGTSDNLIDPNRLLARTLERYGVPHRFEEYDGNHTNNIGNRLRVRVLPFFSNSLRFE